MKIIITEKQNLSLKRRLEEIDGFVKVALERINPEEYMYHDYVDEIVWQVLDEYAGIYRPELFDDIENYVRDNYWKEIETYYLERTK